MNTHFSAKFTAPKRRRWGFSIVERIACVSIIGIVAFLSIPSVTRMRDDRERNLAISDPESLNLAQATLVQRNLGVALNFLVSKGRDTCYSASEAPRQTFFPLPLVERHIVYPLFIGQNAVFMLSDHADSYASEAEWLSMGSPAVKVITALADPASIRDAINRAGATFDPIGVAQMDKGTMSVSANESDIDIMPEDMARINPASPNDSAEELVPWAYFTAVG